MKLLSIILIALCIPSMAQEWPGDHIPGEPTQEQLDFYKELMEMQGKTELSEEDIEKVRFWLMDYYTHKNALYLVILHRLKDVKIPAVEGRFKGGYSTSNYYYRIAGELFQRDDYATVAFIDTLDERSLKRLPLKGVDLKDIYGVVPEELYGSEPSYYVEMQIRKNKIISKRGYVNSSFWLLDLVTADLCLRDPSPNNDYARERLEPYHLFERQIKILNNEPGAMTWHAWEYSEGHTADRLKQIAEHEAGEKEAVKIEIPKENHTAKIIALTLILLALLSAWRIRNKSQTK